MNNNNTHNGFNQFVQLIIACGQTAKTTEKLVLLVDFFGTACEEDCLWTLALFTGRKPKKPITTKQLKQWCIELIQIEEWLFEESYHAVGDLSETIALLISARRSSEKPTIQQCTNNLHEVISAIQGLHKNNDEAKQQFIQQQWLQYSQEEIFVFNKLFSGSFRIGVSQNLIIQALAKITMQPPAAITHAISGNWHPVNISWKDLLYHQSTDDSRPYPFYLAYPLEIPVEDLGAITDWVAEWKWDGIRGQIIKRNNQLFIWSRGEELLTEKFPELHFLQEALPNGIALDGEIIGMQNGIPLPFAALQTRIGRKNVTAKQLKEAPVNFIAYDMMEYKNIDIRDWPLYKRKANLQQLVNEINHTHLHYSNVIEANNWQQLITAREDARNMKAEGFMLKHKNSTYKSGRKTVDWWKWKIKPFTIDAVLLYAQKGHGKRSNLYTDYTFAVQDGEKLVTFAKAYSGLTDKEIVEVDAFVKKNGVEKFGPVRTVKPLLVFEIAFEGIAASTRHKCGVALRFPRISRWRKDKPVAEINTLDDLKSLLQAYEKNI